MHAKHLALGGLTARIRAVAGEVIIPVTEDVIVTITGDGFASTYY